MKKEKTIEKGIIAYLKTTGAIVEGLQGGKILISKGKYKHMMTLQTEGACDIICFYNGKFIGIEVKKDPEKVKEWIKLKERYEKEGKLPKSYFRQENQIKYSHKISKNDGYFMITCRIDEVIQFIETLEKKSKKDL